MSYALPTDLAGAISTYAGLIDAVRDRIDDTGFSQVAIDMAIRQAEAHFNRVFRSPEMEKVVTVIAANSQIDLPTDLLQIKSLRQTVGTYPTLSEVDYSGLLDRYQGRQGTPEAYAKVGNTLVIAPSGSAALSLVYYQRIPGLTAANPSNWLLVAHPDAYLELTVFHVHARNGDAEGAATAGSAYQVIEASIKDADTRAKWGAGPLIPRGGIRQVAGVRA